MSNEEGLNAEHTESDRTENTPDLDHLMARVNAEMWTILIKAYNAGYRAGYKAAMAEEKGKGEA